MSAVCRCAMGGCARPASATTHAAYTANGVAADIDSKLRFAAALGLADWLRTQGITPGSIRYVDFGVKAFTDCPAKFAVAGAVVPTCEKHRPEIRRLESAAA